MNANDKQHRAILQDIAQRAMLERGLLPDFSAEALTELGKIQASAAAKNDESMRDLTSLLWASIDNDDSHDLDQLTVAEVMPGDKVKILVPSRMWTRSSKTDRPLTITRATIRPRSIPRP